MKTTLFFLSIFALYFLILPVTRSVFAATGSLKFDPTTVATDSGKTFTVKVKVDAGTTAIKGTEAFITYDASVLQVQSIDDGKLFKVFQKDNTDGKIYMAGLAESDADAVSTPGTLGAITFKALADGKATLQFYCDATTKKGSSIIQNDASNTNIINCSSNGTSVITVGSGVSASTPTPVPTNAQVTPSSLPKSGIFDNVVQFAVPGGILFLIGTAMRVLL